MVNKLKICLIAPDYPSKIGGVEIVNWNLSKEFGNQGNEVHIITLCNVHNIKINIPENISIHHFSIYRLQNKWRLFSNFFFILEAIIYIVRTSLLLISIKPDIIQAQGPIEAIPALLVKLLKNIPYVLTIHGNLAHPDANPGPGMPRIIRKYWAHLPHIKYADRIVTLTQECKIAIYEVLHRNADIIHNGVDLDIFTSKSGYIMQTYEPKILCVARFDVIKGLEYAIRAMDEVCIKYPRAKLIIIGDGEQYETLHTLISRGNLSYNVLLLGSRPNEEIPKYMQSSHLFLLTSLSEGFALTLLEAMACGLPIISTPVGIAPEIINSWNNGRLIPFMDPDAISSTLIELIENPDLCHLYSQNSIHAAKEYSWSSVSEKYLCEYRSVLNKKIN